MKTKTKRIALGLIMALSVGIMAGCGNNEKVGYVNVAKIQQESTKAVEIQHKIEEKQKTIEERLQKAQKEDSKEEYMKKLQKAQEEMQIFELAMQREFKSKIDSAVANVAQKEELTVVVDKYAELSGGEDITNAVLDEMGRKEVKK